MITEVAGNLVKDDAQALVNTVNTVGIMGKGLALQFKRAFPDVFVAYARACEAGEVRPGKIFAVQLAGIDADERWVLNFPTKRHWRQPSRLDDIRIGLDDLIRTINELGIRSIAVPPLGCGNGGLDWSTVRALVVEKLGDLDIDVRLYVPGTPAPKDMPTNTARPELTAARARLLAALSRYIATAWKAGITDVQAASLVEVQKLAYLLQAAGLPLELRFEKGHFGPFSVALNHGLVAMEGHYLVGYGDGTGGARADLEFVAGIPATVEGAVSGDQAFAAAWERVEKTIYGYEYPEGLEILASTHFLADRSLGQVTDEELVALMAQWNNRKRRVFDVDHVVGAWKRLQATGLTGR